MQICKYCGTTNQYGTCICHACGANEFKYKCDNCGTLYQEANYCPQCGVKAGTKPRSCPRCGAAYYSTACPDCGYIIGIPPAPQETVPVYAQPAAYPAPAPKRRQAWLWVLGWIFIFPLPLTVLTMNSRINGLWKAVIIVIAWLVFFSLIAQPT